MNKIYLDDDYANIYGDCESLNALAYKIREYIKFDDVLFISVNFKFSNTNRSEQTGIELLIWLRLIGITNHCVLFSFETIHALLNRQPKYLVATSSGTSFVQLPIDLDKIDLSELKGIIKDNENLKFCLKAAFSIQEFRHAYANIWGLKRLIEAHELICPKEGLNYNGNSASNSINYQIAEYLFRSPGNPIDSYSLRTAREALSYLRNKSGLNILYIDDQADNGWYAFLKNLLHSDVRLVKLSLNTDDFTTLYADFRQAVIDNRIDLVISDLRLFTYEDELLDYDDFMSIKLMKEIRDEKFGNKLAFPKLSYMLFTAANKLIYYKSMVKGKKYAPQGLFIKEGFDLLYSGKQSFNNYLQLVKTLGSFFAIYKRKSGETVELFDEDECRKVFALEDSIKDNFEEEQQRDIAQRLNGYTHVILDTNIYLHFHNIALCNESVFLTYPVYKELLRNAKDDYSSSIGYLAKYFTDNFKPDKSSLSVRNIVEIDRKFKVGVNMEDLADDYFVEMLEHYAAMPNSNVLFITNDWTDKGGKISAGKQVENWIKSTRVKNVAITKPSILIYTGKLTTNLNQSKSKFQNKINHGKEDSSSIRNAFSSSIPTNATVNKILRIENDFLIISVSGFPNSCCVYLINSNLKGLVQNNDYNILIGLPVRRNNTTKTKFIEGRQYVNINTNELTSELKKILHKA
jgi:hypothetical protein